MLAFQPRRRPISQMTVQLTLPHTGTRNFQPVVFGSGKASRVSGSANPFTDLSANPFINSRSDSTDDSKINGTFGRSIASANACPFANESLDKLSLWNSMSISVSSLALSNSEPTSTSFGDTFSPSGRSRLWSVVQSTSPSEVHTRIISPA